MTVSGSGEQFEVDGAAAVIDATPTPIKELAVRELGSYGKPVLLTVIVVLVLLFTGAIGMIGRHRRAAVVAGAVTLPTQLVSTR